MRLYYMFLRSVIRRNLVTSSILLFLIVFIAVQSFKPQFMFNKDGSFRTFGVGYTNKTVIPIWAFTIVIAIICYVAVSYYSLP